MIMDVNQTYCGDYLAICTNIKSLLYAPENDIMFVCQSDLNKKENNFLSCFFMSNRMCSFRIKQGCRTVR